MKAIGLLPGPRMAHVDHLVPLCQLQGIPILVTEPDVGLAIEQYYPPMEIVYAAPDDYILDPYVEEYTLFYYVYFFRKAHGAFDFVDHLIRKRARSVFALHGNSDKHWEIFWAELLNDEDLVLLYGPQAADRFRAKGVTKEFTFIGNYRWTYYCAHRAFFDRFIHLDSSKVRVLYAPTWSHPLRKSELRFGYSSFWQVHRPLLEEVPEGVQLVVKLHPYHMYLEPEMREMLQERYPHVVFLDSSPLIYPLLQQIDLYVGDYSSIGYDFLTFDRPLFFLGVDPTLPLSQCGVALDGCSGAQMYQKILQHNPAEFREKRRQLYRYAFGEEVVSYLTPKV